MQQLRIYHNGLDISDNIELRDGKATPFGYSHHNMYADIYYDGAIVNQKIGMLVCGEPTHLIDGITYTITDINEEAGNE